MMPASPGVVLDTVTDDFNRASLGSNWVSYGTGDNVSIQDGDLSFGTNAFGPNISWGQSVFSPNQFSEATLALDWDTRAMVMVHTRQVGESSNGGARYGFVWWLIEPPFNLTPQWIIKYDGVPTEDTRDIALSGGGFTAPAPGDVIRVESERIGPTVYIRGYHNGTLVLSGEDTASDRITTGSNLYKPPAGNGGRGVVRPGLVSRFQLGVTPIANQPIVSQWRGGTLYPGV